jgi:hypothetical protein
VVSLNMDESKPKWPTLEGRLNQPLTSRKQALLQLYECYKMGGISMSEKALEEVERYLKQDKKLQETRKKVQAAVDASPNSVTFEEAKKQVEKSHEQISKKKSVS